MSAWVWILIVVVVVVVALLVIGAVLGRRRRISLARPAAPAQTTAAQDQPPVRGGYRSKGSISFSQGSGGTALAPRPRSDRPTDAPASVPLAPAHPAGDRTEVDGQPGVGDDAAVPRDSVRPTVVEVPLPDADVATAPPVQRPPARPAAPTQPPTTRPEGTAPASPQDRVSAPPRPATPTAPHAPGTGTAAGGTAASTVPTVPSGTALPDLDGTAAPVAPPDTAPAAPTAPAEPAAPAAPPVAAERVEPEEVELEEIDPTTGRLSRLRGRLSRSQNAFGRSLLGLLGAGTLDEDSWTEVEDTLLMADLGAAAAVEITERLRQEVAARGVVDAAGARAMLRRVMIDAVETTPAGPLEDRSVRALAHDGRPAVLLVVGVNGTGKTTTTGKLARVLVADGHTVVLGAADTFRAAAADQLATWASRVGATVVRGAAGADPAAVAFDAVKQGIAEGADAVVVDTAGRLHTKTGLMDELGKVKRVIEKQAEVDEVLLVLDATTGQNGLVQAKVFAEVVDITGIVLTKLDGTAKGGIVVAVQRALGVPVKLVGLGEGPDDLAPFEADAFVDALLGD
ncbi:signal recognition particle-docking protein FtsY [Nakamurella endophytica]|uniref:signal recognition particle-docking protein FtsY n=1 Tax=Nakamurella endophytica TaxID=1748367 RepID=UPI001E59DC46|nr:signal recognition particle-docking protein FtsY [Nakamurella endophytica]